MARAKGGSWRVMAALAAATLAAPLLVLIAVLGASAGVWSIDFALHGLTLSVARWLALAGVAAAAIALALAVKDIKRRGPFAALAVVAAGATLAVFLVQQPKFGPASGDVATDTADAPGLSDALRARRDEAGAVALGAPTPCAAFVPSQIAPQAAADALRAVGFRPIGSAAFRAEGFRRGDWFGLTHDAVIRIRPGRTDVRVSAREAVDQGDAACRLAARLVAELQARR